MFTAIVIVCHTFIANDCVLAYDVYGPYKTKKECMERVEVMQRDIDIQFRQKGIPFAPVGYKCEKKVSV